MDFAIRLVNPVLNLPDGQVKFFGKFKLHKNCNQCCSSKILLPCFNDTLSYIGETGRNLSTRLTEHKLATSNGDVNNHIAEHHLKTKHQIDWDSATCITYSTDCYQRLTLESWFTNLEQTPLNRSQQLPAPYTRLIDEIKEN